MSFLEWLNSLPPMSYLAAYLAFAGIAILTVTIRRRHDAPRGFRR